MKSSSTPLSVFVLIACAILFTSSCSRPAGENTASRETGITFSKETEEIVNSFSLWLVMSFSPLKKKKQLIVDWEKCSTNLFVVIN